MLARPEKFRCVECGLPFGSPLFHYYHGEIGQGAAYWSDRGVLCSPACALQHHLKRRAEGSVASAPAPDPMDAAASRK